MTRERAIEIIRWGVYAKPAIKNEAERQAAIEYVKTHPDTWEEIQWTSTH